MDFAARLGLRTRLSVALLALTMVGCGQVPPSTSSADTPFPPGQLALPTAKPFPSGMPEACAGVGLSAVVRGDPRDPRVAWLVANDQTRMDVTWPSGYHARFIPGLEVLDASGAVVLRDGDPVTGACVTSDPNIHHLEPPFK